MIQINSQLANILKNYEQKPIMRVDMYDTAFTVPSHGWFTRYYNNICPSNQVTPGDSTLCRTQFEDKIFYDWSNGVPTPLSNYVGFAFNASGVGVGAPYMVSWSGYFFADQPGQYVFSTKAYGRTRILIGNTFTDVLSGTWQTSGLSTQNNWNMDLNKGTYFSGYATLSTGWTPIKIDYGFAGGLESGVLQCHVAAFYTPPNGNETLLTASRVTPSGAFLNPITLNNVMNINEDTDQTGAQFIFEVPIVGADQFQWGLGRQSFGVLAPNKLVKIFAGYATQSGWAQTSGYTQNLQICSDYVQRFIGFIDSLSISQDYESLTANVKCRDFSKKTTAGINENYPNFASYTQDALKHIDPINNYGIEGVYPQAYDKWYLVDAIKDIILHAGIDPIYFNSTLINIANYFRLEHNLSWPSCNLVNIDGSTTINGDPFNFRFNYGTKLSDMINQICDDIGYAFRFDEQGNAFVKDPRYTNRIECFETSGVNTGAVTYSGLQYTPYFNTNCSNRLYLCNVSGFINDNDAMINNNTFSLHTLNGTASDSSVNSYNLIPSGAINYTSSPIPPAYPICAGPFQNNSFYSLSQQELNALSLLTSFVIEFDIYPILSDQSRQHILSLTNPYSDITEIILSKSNDINLIFENSLSRKNTSGVTYQQQSSFTVNGEIYYQNVPTLLYPENQHITISGVINRNQWNHVAIEIVNSGVESSNGKLNIFVNNTGYYTLNTDWFPGMFGTLTSGMIGRTCYDNGYWAYSDGWTKGSNGNWTNYPLVDYFPMAASGIYLSNFRISDLSYNNTYSYPSGNFPTVDKSVIISGTSVAVVFSGVGCSMYYSTPINGGNYSINIKKTSNNSIILTTGLNLPSGTIIYGQKMFITNTMPSDSYTLNITPSGNSIFKFEGIEYYTKNIFNPVYQFNSNQDITTLNMEFTDQDLRNEVIVVGQQYGSTISNSTTTNSPVYIYGRAVDLDSMANINAVNFAGGKRTFVAVEPRIQSQPRLDWMSQSILQMYHNNSRNITLGCVGNPSIQQGDAIGIYSPKVGINTSGNSTLYSSGLLNDNVYDTFWVQKITSTISKTNYITNLTVSTYPPVDCWRSALPITKQLVNSFISQNGSIFSDFVQLTKNSQDLTAYDCRSYAPCYFEFDSIVDLDRLYVFVDDTPLEILRENAQYYYQTLDNFQGSSVHDTLLNVWIANIGDYLNIGSPLFNYQYKTYNYGVTGNVMSEDVHHKTQLANASGYLNNILVQAGTYLQRGEQMCVIDGGYAYTIDLNHFNRTAISQFENNNTLLGAVQKYDWVGQTTIVTGVQIPSNLYWIHNAGGELNGSVIVPKSGDDFKGQYSTNILRINGTYPMAIWGVGTYSDGTTFGQQLGLWHLPYGSSDAVSIAGHNYPAFKVKSTPCGYVIQVSNKSTNYSPFTLPYLVNNNLAQQTIINTYLNNIPIVNNNNNQDIHYVENMQTTINSNPTSYGYREIYNDFSQTTYFYDSATSELTNDMIFIQTNGKIILRCINLYQHVTSWVWDSTTYGLPTQAGNLSSFLKLSILREYKTTINYMYQNPNTEDGMVFGPLSTAPIMMSNSFAFNFSSAPRPSTSLSPGTGARDDIWVGTNPEGQYQEDFYEPIHAEFMILDGDTMQVLGNFVQIYSAFTPYTGPIIKT